MLPLAYAISGAAVYRGPEARSLKPEARSLERPEGRHTNNDARARHTELHGRSFRLARVLDLVSAAHRGLIGDDAGSETFHLLPKRVGDAYRLQDAVGVVHEVSEEIADRGRPRPLNQYRVRAATAQHGVGQDLVVAQDELFAAGGA